MKRNAQEKDKKEHKPKKVEGTEDKKPFKQFKK